MPVQGLNLSIHGEGELVDAQEAPPVVADPLVVDEEEEIRGPFFFCLDVVRGVLWFHHQVKDLFGDCSVEPIHDRIIGH